MGKKTVFSGIKATSSFTLGNYIGALKGWPMMQDEFDCYYSIVDLHSLTVRMNPSELHSLSLSNYALFLALGLDPKKSVLFIQSHVAQHAEINWILACYTYMGELSRMTQYKDKAQKGEQNLNAGLFTYPVLMAGDIFLYDTEIVPVGEDQMQHVELARDVAVRFNGIYGDAITVPQGQMPKVGARIMDLQDPTKKMSKSDENESGKIDLLEPIDAAVKKIKRAVTDSDAKVYFSADKPGIANLMQIYSVITGKDYKLIEREFDGKGYGDFKGAVADAVISVLGPLQAEHKRYLDDKAYLNSLLKDGYERAAAKAEQTLGRIKSLVGLVPRP